ncbi:MoxR family ATPase [Candidatus Sumerlaeota bacterium]|nr:MoxR family ATPase [Candidatus Sumerlaeota bacterium]
MNPEIMVINEKVKEESQFVDKIIGEISRIIVGQRYLVERLLIGLLTGGHILVEGVPGLAKTLSVKSLAACVRSKFQRLQFTPDMLPADIIGTMVFDPKTGSFFPKKGPIFANIILADEINRAPAKVQSALLEAMQEKQVTIGEQTYKLEEPFLVMATQNPIEQEGTYPLPEAQIDRFMLKLNVTYPNKREEKEILERMSSGQLDIDVINPVISPEDIIKARSVVNQIYVDEKIKNYVIDIVFATREPEAYGLEIKPYVEWGASPRASIYLVQAARAHAFLRHRGHVIPDDVKAIGLDVLRHRVIITYEAEAEELTAEDVVRQVFDHIEVP